MGNYCRRSNLPTYDPVYSQNLNNIRQGMYQDATINDLIDKINDFAIYLAQTIGEDITSGNRIHIIYTGFHGTHPYCDLDQFGDKTQCKILPSLRRNPNNILNESCLLYTSPSPRDATLSRMPSSA